MDDVKELKKTAVRTGWNFFADSVRERYAYKVLFDKKGSRVFFHDSEFRIL